MPNLRECWAARVLKVDTDFSKAIGVVRAVVGEPRAGQVLVKVAACSVNPVDWRLGSNYYNYADYFLTMPFTLGYDFCGEVVSANACQRVKVGDRVFGCALVTKPGTFAEFFIVDEAVVALAPAGLSDLEAAALPLVSLASLQALRAGRIQKGHKVLILGGAGGTGLIGCQLAKAMGAVHLVVTCSSLKGQICLDNGADRFVDAHTEDWTVALRGQSFDIIYDCVGGRESWIAAANPDFNLLKPDGWYVTIAGDKQEPQTVSKSLGIALTTIGRKFMSFLPKHPNYTFITCERLHLDLDYIKRLAEEGKLRPHIDRVFPPHQVIEALAYSATGHATGKIVINCTETWQDS